MLDSKTPTVPDLHLWLTAGLILCIVVAAALVAYLLFRLLKGQASEIPGKRDIIKSVYFIFGIICAFGIMAVVALLGRLDGSTVGNVFVMLATALGVKKLDDWSGAQK